MEASYWMSYPHLLHIMEGLKARLFSREVWSLLLLGRCPLILMNPPPSDLRDVVPTRSYHCATSSTFGSSTCCFSTIGVLRGPFICRSHQWKSNVNTIFDRLCLYCENLSSVVRRKGGNSTLTANWIMYLSVSLKLSRIRFLGSTLFTC